MREKKTLVALALSTVLPSLTHSAPRLEYSVGAGSYPLSGRRQTRRQTAQKGWKMNSLKNWLAGAFTNPSTGQASHTKIWANVACAAMTYKFVVTDAPMEIWAVYGCIVGGYALGKRGLAIIPQLAQIRQRREQNVDATDE